MKHNNYSNFVHLNFCLCMTVPSSVATGAKPPPHPLAQKNKEKIREKRAFSAPTRFVSSGTGV